MKKFEQPTVEVLELKTEQIMMGEFDMEGSQE